MPKPINDTEEGVLTREKTDTRKPPMYRVLLHNDDYTTMPFVVYVLQNIFQHNEDDAHRIMMAVHRQGIGVAGTYTYEIAETKMTQTIRLARANEYPLLCTIEPE
jgi:ATP-dependent Clp protease adaptor protein ClpS